MPEAAVGPPDSLRVQPTPADIWREPDRAGVKVRTSAAGLGLRIDVATLTGVARVLLRWRRRFAEDVLVLGDAWERSYGELEWRALRAERPLPWTVLVHDRLSGATQGLGVEVRGASFAFWTVDADGITLVLDPSSPGVLDLVAEDIERFTGWGFELLKHDYSTYDLLGRWGPDMGASPADDGWALANPAITTAEALVAFYARVRAAAGDAVVLGCNVVGHLAAGLVHAQRIGDDTSGIDWDRTRRVGVNALAFRLAQHGVFFAVDADLVPSTPRTDWAMNRQFLDLVARSGTVLFVSVDPATRSGTVDADLAAALRLALDGGVPGGAEPLDWLYAPTPRRWRSGDGEVTYSWLEPLGADPFEPGTSPV